MRRFVPLACVLVCLGCAPSNPGLVIEGTLAIPESCVFSSTSTTYTLAPTLDTADYGGLRPLGIRYDAQFRVVNRLLQLFNNRYPVRAEPNVITLQYAEIQLLEVDGTAPDLGGLPNPFRVTTGATIPPSATATGTPGIAPVEVIPPLYGDALLGRVGRLLASVRITGTTSGGATVTTGEYLFPIELCNRCLVACDPDLALTENTCLLGQDRVVTIGVDVAPGCVF